MTAYTPKWVAPGTEVYPPAGRGYGPVLTIARVTKTLIILDDGTKYRVKDLLPLGTPTGRNYGAGPLRLRSKAELDDTRLRGEAAKLSNTAAAWARRPADGQGADELRAALKALAPHLGLAVTDSTTVDPENERLDRRALEG